MVFFAVVFLTSQVSYAYLVVHSVDISGKQSECIMRAENAMKKIGLLNVTSVNNKIFGDDAPYEACIECRAEKGVAFIVIGGPQRKENTVLMDKLWKEFEK
jgi:hypothetical protein